jgi:hypothetical protein
MHLTGFFIEWLEQAGNRFGFAHDLSGLLVVAAAHQDRRQGPSPAEFNPAHSRHVDVQQQARVAGRKLAGQQLFRALKDQYIEAQHL